MATILDSRDDIAKLDIGNGLKSIEELGSQIKQAWEETRMLDIPAHYGYAQNVVVAGMGGSAYGTHVIQTLFKDELKIPVFSIPDYTLPSWVNEKSIVLLSSYSGSTEETLAAGEDAKAKKAKVIGLTSGGKLEEFLRANGYPAYVFKPQYNFCNVPRYALGYSVFGQIALLQRLGLLTITQEDVNQVLEIVADVHIKNGVAAPSDTAAAKLLAYECVEKIPIVVVSDFLEGAAHVVANAFNETAKNYSEYRVVPELNHHLMEGLAFPKSNDSNLVFLTMHSSFYNPSNAKRMKLTESVIEQNKNEFRSMTLGAKTKLAQVFELLTFGAYASFYLAMLNNQNPTPNVWVDWFKAELKK